MIENVGAEIDVVFNETSPQSIPGNVEIVEALKVAAKNETFQANLPLFENSITVISKLSLMWYDPFSWTFPDASVLSKISYLPCYFASVLSVEDLQKIPVTFLTNGTFLAELLYADSNPFQDRALMIKVWVSMKCSHGETYQFIFIMPFFSIRRKQLLLFLFSWNLSSSQIIGHHSVFYI